MRTPVSFAHLCNALACVAMLFAIAMPAGAASTTFSGSLFAVFEDDGTGQYAGAAAGDPFNGQFFYGNSPGEATYIGLEPTESGFEFIPYPVFLSNGSTSVTGNESFVTIQNNFALDQDEADLVFLILNQQVNPGTLADAWSVSGLESGAFEIDLTPNDSDDTEDVVGGILFEVSYFSLDTNLIDSLGYNPTPPGLDAVDAAIFTITEGDSEGNVIFSALGIVETAAAVIPVPAAAWLFGSALGLLGLARRRLA